MSQESLSAYLVEDEPLCRADFCQTLRAFPEIQLLGETDNLSKARDFLTNHSVDLLFLDLSLGRENGLDLVETLPRRPLVIALTAHPQHAVRGFTLELVDYILKPVEEARLRVALDKARHRKATASLQPGRVTFIAEIDGEKIILELAEIIGAESMGNYVLLHTSRGSAVKRATFKHVRQKLPPSLFLETSRGRLVARHAITGWKRDALGHLLLQVEKGSPLRVSRSHAAGVLKILEGKSAR